MVLMPMSAWPGQWARRRRQSWVVAGDLPSLSPGVPLLLHLPHDPLAQPHTPNPPVHRRPHHDAPLGTAPLRDPPLHLTVPLHSRVANPVAQRRTASHCRHTTIAPPVVPSAPSSPCRRHTAAARTPHRQHAQRRPELIRRRESSSSSFPLMLPHRRAVRRLPPPGHPRPATSPCPPMTAISSPAYKRPPRPP